MDEEPGQVAIAWWKNKLMCYFAVHKRKLKTWYRRDINRPAQAFIPYLFPHTAHVGASCGAIVFTVEACKAAYEKGQDVILVRHETSPEDIVGLQVRRIAGKKKKKRDYNKEKEE